MGLTKKAKHWLWIGGAVITLLVYFLGWAWWESIPPNRPRNIAPDAVFVYVPPVGSPFPLPKRGDWLNCWFDQDQNADRCRMSNMDGSLEYEGVFLPSEETAPVPASDLQIDMRITPNRLAWVYFREQTIPIIKLRNGVMLLPAEAYDEGKKKEKEWLSNTRGQSH
jgi:hypothetical protein